MRDPTVREPSYREPTVVVRDPTVREPSVREPSYREPTVYAQEPIDYDYDYNKDFGSYVMGPTSAVLWEDHRGIGLGK